MSGAMTAFGDHPDPWLPDAETWDVPDRLTEAEMFAEAGAGWRRGEIGLDDPENVR